MQPSPLKRSRRASEAEAPLVPDVGEAWDESMQPSRKLKRRQLPPVCPGMQPARKLTQAVMDKLHRSKIPAAVAKRGSPKYRGLPRNCAMGIPLLRKHVRDWYQSLAPGTRRTIHDKKGGV